MTEETQLDKAQYKAIERVKTLNLNQLQRFLIEFEHEEKLEMYPDLFIRRAKAVVVHTYDSRRGRYVRTDASTFIGYLQVVPLKENKVMCFATDRIDIFEGKKLRSSRVLPQKWKPLHLWDLVHLKKRKRIVLAQRRSGFDSLNLLVFSTDGRFLSSLNVSGDFREMGRFKKGISVTVAPQDSPNVRIYDLDTSDNLSFVVEYQNAATALSFAGGKYVIVHRNKAVLFNEGGVELFSQSSVGPFSTKLTSARFAINSGELYLWRIDIFDVIHDSMVRIQTIHGPPLPWPVRITDEMFLTSQSVWMLESPKRYREIQSDLPPVYIQPKIEHIQSEIGYVQPQVGFISSLAKSYFAMRLAQEMTKVPDVIAGIVVDFIA